VAIDPYVPTRAEDAPRRSVPIPPAQGWRAARPGELGPEQPTGRLLGSPGPDGGYALQLAERFKDRIEIAFPEKVPDVLAVGAALAMKRAASFGRAPIVRDLEIALGLLGWLGGAPAELIEWRRHAVHGAAHHYAERRGIVDAVPTSLLRTPPEDQVAALASWREWLVPEAC